MRKRKGLQIASLALAASILLSSVPIYGMGYRQEDEQTKIDNLQVGDWVETDRTYLLGPSYQDTDGNMVEYGDKIVFYTYGNTRLLSEEEKNKISLIDLTHKREGFYTAYPDADGNYPVDLSAAAGNDLLINDITTYPASDVSMEDCEVYTPAEFGVYAARAQNYPNLDNEYMANGNDESDFKYMIKSITFSNPENQDSVTLTAEELVNDYFGENTWGITLYDASTHDGRTVYAIGSIGGFTNIREKAPADVFGSGHPVLFVSENTAADVTRDTAHIWSEFDDLVYEETAFYGYDNPYERGKQVLYHEIDGIKYVVQKSGSDYANSDSYSSYLRTHEENGITYLDKYGDYTYPENTFVFNNNGTEYRMYNTYISSTGDIADLYGGVRGYGSNDYENPPEDKGFFAVEGQDVGKNTSIVKYDTVSDRALEYETYIGCGLKPVDDSIFLTDLKRGDVLEGGKTYNIFFTELSEEYENSMDSYDAQYKDDLQAHWAYGTISSGAGYRNYDNDSYAFFGTVKKPIEQNMLFSDTLSGYLFNYTGTFTYKDGTATNFATRNDVHSSFSSSEYYIYNKTGGSYSDISNQYYITIETPAGYNWRFDGFEVQSNSDKILAYRFMPMNDNAEELLTVSIEDYFTGCVIDSFIGTSFDDVQWSDENYLPQLFAYNEGNSAYEEFCISDADSSITLYAMPKNISMEAEDYHDKQIKDRVIFVYDNDSYDGSDFSSITYSLSRGDLFTEEAYPYVNIKDSSDFYRTLEHIDIGTLEDVYNRNEWQDYVPKFLSAEKEIIYINGNTFEEMDMSGFTEKGCWKINATLEEDGSVSIYDIKYVLSIPFEVLEEYPVIYAQSSNPDMPVINYTEGDSSGDFYGAEYDFDTEFAFGAMGINADRSRVFAGIIGASNAACTQTGSTEYSASVLFSEEETNVIQWAYKDESGADFSVFESIGYDSSSAKQYTKKNFSYTNHPEILSCGSLSMYMKKINSFEDLKDVNGEYTSIFIMCEQYVYEDGAYRYKYRPTFAFVPTETGVTVMYDYRRSSDTLPATGYPGGRYSFNWSSPFVDTFTTVDDYNAFLDNFLSSSGNILIPSGYGVRIALVNTGDIQIGTENTRYSGQVSNCVNTDGYIEMYSYAKKKVPLSKEIPYPALGHTWTDSLDGWTELNPNALSDNGLVDAIESMLGIMMPDNPQEAFSLLIRHAENGSTINPAALADSNNSLYGTLCTRAQDAYELKLVHVHAYGEPQFDWSEDYSSCTAEFICTSDDDTQILDCVITQEQTDPSCTTDGRTKYTATVTFMGQEYSDTKTVPADRLGHDYIVPPVFIWSEDCSSCTAEFTCRRNDDVLSLACEVAKEINSPTCIKKGKTKYTATVTFMGQEYSDTRYADMEPLSHIWSGEWMLVTDPVTEELLAGAENEIADFNADTQDLYISYCARAKDAYILKAEKKTVTQPDEKPDEPEDEEPAQPDEETGQDPEPDEPPQPDMPQDNTQKPEVPQQESEQPPVQQETPQPDQLAAAPQTGDSHAGYIFWLAALLLCGISAIAAAGRKMKR